MVGPAANPLMVTQDQQADVSVTEAGQRPESSGTGERTIQVPRRPLEARGLESMAEAAVTPQAFVARVQSARDEFSRVSSSAAGEPRSYGPPPKIEEFLQEAESEEQV